MHNNLIMQPSISSQCYFLPFQLCPGFNGSNQTLLSAISSVAVRKENVQIVLTTIYLTDVVWFIRKTRYIGIYKLFKEFQVSDNVSTY